VASTLSSTVESWHHNLSLNQNVCVCVCLYDDCVIDCDSGRWSCEWVGVYSQIQTNEILTLFIFRVLFDDRNPLYNTAYHTKRVLPIVFIQRLKEIDSYNVNRCSDTHTFLLYISSYLSLSLSHTTITTITMFSDFLFDVNTLDGSVRSCRRVGMTDWMSGGKCWSARSSPEANISKVVITPSHQFNKKKQIQRNLSPNGTSDNQIEWIEKEELTIDDVRLCLCNESVQ
jgi:hypothetical protein